MSLKAIFIPLALAGRAALTAACCCLLFAKVAAGQIAQAPLLQAQAVAPLVLLTLGRDEKLYNAAYNDYSDIDGDGVIDVGYRPAITYYGYFDSYKCYDYDTSSKRFKPASDTSNKKCSAKWSGDFLNYITTSRIDALRRVLYGGKRVVDTGTQTILERSYIPQDAHTWGREYDATVDSYLISDYTPLAQPTTGTRHFFANTSRNGDPSTPLMRVLQNRTERIWNWVAKEGPVADNVLDESGATVSPADYVVRVEACVTGLLEPECKGYPAASPTKYKPTGVLHDYGESRSIAFGLLTGSFQNQRAGGVLRKNISYFDDEIDFTNCQFKSSVYGIVYHINQLKIAQWGPGYPGGCAGGSCKDYGSPTAEMMYEGLRYLGGATSPVSAFDYTDPGSVDSSLGLKKVSWLDPYRSIASGGFPYCAKPVQMAISDVYPSYDSDQLPGTAFGSFSAPATPTTLSSLNVASIAASISTGESVGGNYFIGESLDNSPTTDRSPSLKTVTSLGRIRGLAPGEPTRQGSYYSASVARFGKTNDINPVQGAQKVTTYAVALSAPLPKLSFGYGGAKVSMIPYGQSVGGCDYGDFNSSTRPMQNRIAAFYIDRIVNVPGFATDGSAATGNSGRPYGRFRVSFEDNIEGTDNDMDAIVTYTFAVTSTGQLKIDLTSDYAAGCIDQHMGFIIAGTTQDGTYLGVRDRDGACNTTALNDAAFSTAPGKCAGGLGWAYSRTFSLATASSSDANIPRDPLFYAAKWGGPGVNEDTNAAAIETVVGGSVSVPGYFYVSDPQKLRAQLTAAFSEISRQGAPTTAAVATGAFVRTNSALFLPGYMSEKMTVNDAEGDDVNPVVGVSVWEGTLAAKRFQTSSSTVTLTPQWTVSNSSFPAVNATSKTTSRKVYTKIGADRNALLLPANLDSTLISRLSPASVQTLLASHLTSVLGATPTAAQKAKETADQVALYVLGNRKLELRKGGTLRSRRALLGDIVNSTPAYQGPLDEGWGAYTASIAEATTYGAFVNGKAAAQTVYVGANDGMLHAFNASTGEERWAFIPETVQSMLPLLVDPGYSHRYFVDGNLTVSDAYVSGGWKSILVGALGAGGKSIYAIDVTNPASPTILWEFSDADLGYVLSKPQIVRLADGTWVAVVTNGYESARVSGASTVTVGRLFVLRLSDGASLGSLSNLTVTTPTGVVNGLGSPAIRLRDGIAEAAWVGDLAGNLWKFDLGADVKTSTAGAVKVAYSGAPLFTAIRSGTRQPITSEPSLVPFFEGGTMVVFGTGKFFEVADLSSTATQSIYGIWDWSDWNTLTRSGLATATMTDNGDYRFFTGTSGWWTGASPKRGWYADFPNAGERVVAPSTTLFGSTIVSSLIANSSDPCVISKDGLLMAISPFTGGNPPVPVFDTTGDGKVTTADVVGGQPPGGVRLIDPVSLVAVNTGGNAVGYDSKGKAQIELKGSKPQGRRSWRQLR